VISVRNLYNSPRAVHRRENPHLEADDRLAFLASTIALSTLGAHPPARAAPEVSTELLKTERHIALMLDSALTSRSLDPLMRGFSRALCSLAEQDRSFALPSVLPLLMIHCERLEDKEVGLRLARLLPVHESPAYEAQPPQSESTGVV
jgi:hypothetical protein